MMMSYAVAVDFEYQPNIRTCTAEFGSASCLRQRIKSQRSALFALTVALSVVNTISISYWLRFVYRISRKLSALVVIWISITSNILINSTKI